VQNSGSISFNVQHLVWCTPNSLRDPSAILKQKNEKKGFKAHSLTHNTCGVKGCVKYSKWD